MAHRKLIAKKDFRYGTRMLVAGEPVTMSGPLARLHGHLGNVGKPEATVEQHTQKPAAPAPAPVPTPAAPVTPVVDTAMPVELPALRAAYEAKFGKKPFNGWPAETLREKLAAE